MRSLQATAWNFEPEGAKACRSKRPLLQNPSSTCRPRGARFYSTRFGTSADTDHPRAVRCEAEWSLEVPSR